MTNVATNIFETGKSTSSAVYRKVALRLIPFLMLCYVAAYLDRVNVGFAKLQMLGDLGFSEAVYGFGAGVFFIGYFLFEVPSNLYLHKVGVRATMCRIMVLWGLLSAGFAFVETPAQFYVLRFLLGAAEAGFYPGVILYLTYWFPSHVRARAIGVFMCAIPVSGLIGSPLSGWIMGGMHEVHGLAGWKWLFLIEAMPAVMLGIIAYFYLDDKPKDAKWLTADEKTVLESELASDVAKKSQHASTTFLSMLKSRFTAVLIILVFAQATGQYALSFWLPSLIKNAGFTGMGTIGLMTAIPYAFAIAAMILMTRSSDKRRERRWHLAAAFSVAATALCMSVLSSGSPYAVLASLCLAASAAFSASALFWALPPAFLSGAASAAGIAMINAIGGLAGFAAPYFMGYVNQSMGSTDVALYAIAGFLIFAALMTFTLPKAITNR
jgi:D-galactonate transporter